MCFSFIYNEKMPGGADFTDKGKAVVDKYPLFKAYVELLRAEFADRLASRNSCSFFRIQVILMTVATVFGLITCVAQASVLIAQMSAGKEEDAGEAESIKSA